MKVAVVGHIEWATFAQVEHPPGVGEIIHATRSWEEPAGGGSVAALQLAQLADECLFFTSVGDDRHGQASISQLEAKGVRVYAAMRPTLATRRVFVHIDGRHERTLTVLGQALSPDGDDNLPWHELASVDAVYFTHGNVAALKAARQASCLVATARMLPLLKEAALPLDALVRSRHDNSERYESGDLVPAPDLIVTTDGASGGTTSSGLSYSAETMPPENFQDTYGCGDSFAAGLTFGLGSGQPLEEVLKLAAHCGALAAQRRGAFQAP